MTLDRLMNIAADSGGILYLMMAILLVALTVIIDRLLYLQKTIRRGDELVRKVSAARSFDEGIQARAPSTDKASPQDLLLHVAAAHADTRHPHLMQSIIEEAILLQAPKIDRRIWMLDTIVTLAPLLGLLGTIFGMFSSFQALGQVDGAPTQISAGIAEALLSTAAGLLIAIIGLVCFNHLNNSVRIVIHQLDTLKTMLCNRLSGHQAKTAGNDNLISLPKYAEAGK